MKNRYSHISLNLVLLFFFTLTAKQLSAQPNTIWASYWGDGATYGTEVSGIVYDKTGYIYLCGHVSADELNNLSSPGAYKQQPGIAGDGYIAKFDTLGNRIWSSYIGNSFDTKPTAIAIDMSGNVIIAAVTFGIINEVGTPGTYNHQMTSTPSPIGGPNGIIVKFDPNGNKIWGTYLTRLIDSNFSFQPNSVICDNQNNIIVTGEAINTWNIPSVISTFPSSTTFQPIGTTGNQNAFIMKLNTGGNFIWGSYYGNGSTHINSVTVNTVNEVFIAGITTNAPNIASSGAAYPGFVPIKPTSNLAGFIAKFNPNGQRLWGTYTNGINTTNGMLITDPSGSLYLTGTTQYDTGIATPGTYQQQRAGLVDLCITKWSASGQKTWGTYYGGEGIESYGGYSYLGPRLYDTMSNLHTHIRHPQSYSLSIADDESIVVAGGFATPPYSFKNIQAGCTYSLKETVPGDGFIAKFYPDGKIKWGSYYDVYIRAIACGKHTSLYIGTNTSLDGLTTVGSFQPLKLNNQSAGFISKLQGEYLCPDIQENVEINDRLLQVSTGYTEYQWYRNGSVVIGATSNSYTAVDSGHYYVTFRDACKCLYTSDIVFMGQQQSGIAELGTELKLFVYPNPTNGRFEILASAAKPNVVNYTISDISGRVMKTDHFSARSATHREMVDLSEFAPGIYFINFLSNIGSANIKLVYTK
jgi:hypothetical protein